MKRLISCSVVLALIIAAQAVRADVKTKERVQFQLGGALGKIVNFFGGSATREGIVSTVAVKGNRKSSMTESTGQIIDLSEQKIYDLDLKKKEYKVTTFDEMRKKIQEDRERAEKQAKSQPAEKEDPQKSGKELEFEASVKETGQRKQIAGYDTHEVVLTITGHEKGKTIEDSGGIVLTNDMWLAPKIAALDEIYQFEMKYFQAVYGQALGVDPRNMATVMAMFPSFQKMAQQMQAEGSKLQGTALFTTMTFEGVKSAEEMKSSSSSSSGGDSGGGGGGLAGRLGGLMNRKKGGGGDSDKPSPKSMIFTSTVERLSVETSASADDVAIPAGFKEKK